MGIVKEIDIAKLGRDNKLAMFMFIGLKIWKYDPYQMIDVTVALSKF